MTDRVQVLTRGRVLLVVAVGGIVALLSVAASLQVGSYEVDWSLVWDGGGGADREVAMHRLLRSLLAFSVGASLASVGCVFQALTPL